MTEKIAIETRCLSSLSKVFPDAEPASAERSGFGSALRGEHFSFQIAYRAPELTRTAKVCVSVAAPGLEGKIAVKAVGLAPSALPCYGDPDDDILRGVPGLYPDPLLPLGPDDMVKVPPRQWRSLWIEAAIGRDARAGAHAIEIAFVSEAGESLAHEVFALEVIPAELPEQELIHTEWLHADCLATEYGVDIFSARHWALIEAYVGTAAKHGMNMLLTPLFTPPLDTAVGGERPTVQLVDVRLEGDVYRFGFDKLTRWIEMGLRKGIRYFEFSHLFTQWGAKHAPKIEALAEGVPIKLFGWHTDAAGAPYRRFLDAFLPELVAYIRARGLENRVYFHVSDEPHEADVESYRAASDIMRKHMSGFPIIDALSDFAFYELGLVGQPIPSNDRIDPFLAAGVPELWTYYCCSQYKDVANRFFDMPSARSRVLGLQLYKFGIKGFLHWGFNFWYEQYSKRPIRPFEVTDAGGAFPSGDAFLVYPGNEGDGPVESIRLKVVREALQDQRALQLLERLTGRDAAIALVERDLDEPLTFAAYPRDAAWLLRRRERINQAIRDALR
ncbi:DUF4091 domain-containing protein [Cohnella rhizosphaerae]|uniref:DUF4091 domain-containing protein n=1 Tax=Cohnella rhizosphaerae TaxID=1457232 RepID=A0A9X4KY65_9BACL|nr:DUF4091 domain-containing protein [Cohnella rhizosphaerae]MDG0812648.1 DUF4091 domain-containing protein [Cohnella rhizosphaerae]